MPITRNDWRVIQKYVEGRLAEQGESFTQAVVIKRDDVNKLVWCKEFGDLPIPLFFFDFKVRYYDTDSTGVVNVKTATVGNKDVEVVTPAVGDVVLIIRLLGSSRLPRCIGVLKSKNFSGGGE